MEKTKADEMIQDILSEVCDNCKYPCMVKDQETLMREYCDTCPLEANLEKLAASAHLSGQILRSDLARDRTESDSEK